MTRRLRPFVALIALVLVLVGGCADDDAPTSAPTTGAGYQAGDGSFTLWTPEERAAPVTLAGESLDGAPVDSADWRGDVVVVNFWYASCPPCRAEAPDLVELAGTFDDVHFLGVNPRDEAGAARAFEERFAVPYPTILDPQAEVVAAMQGVVPLQAMPTTVVLDREGRPAGRVLGRIDPEILSGIIEDTLEETK
ncbi:MAG: TlpA disulfide reductase family protein [Bowdeniella nasicola]|nr:TlpA disulfide reductase family protein [Bowdeniella nasicola]